MIPEPEKSGRCTLFRPAVGGFRLLTRVVRVLGSDIMIRLLLVCLLLLAPFQKIEAQIVGASRLL
jgi:hypothetical protein